MIKSTFKQQQWAERFAMLCIAFVCASCSLTKWINRTETDTYTHVYHDTTVIERVRNEPGKTTDTSKVAESSRTRELITDRRTMDSIEVRDYPNFLRLGVLEVAGVYTADRGSKGAGMLGAFAALDNKDVDLTHNEMVRVAPLEIRLRWFDDAPNWTFGTSAFENWQMDDTIKHGFTSIIGCNQYVRRRFYLRDQIPYVIAMPFLGISEFPSAYINIGGELQVGSFGGLNLRAYVGFISGFDWALPSVGGTYPYAALGVSVLDYTNRLEETQHEWKDYVRTTINTNALEVTGGKSFAQVRFASVQFPLPIGNHHAWVGTSLVDYMNFGDNAAGSNQAGLDILPARIGYRQYISSDWMLEPFAEFGFYPSTMLSAALRLRVQVGDWASLGGVAGYAIVSPGNYSPDALSFTAPFVGLTIFAGDWNNTPEKIGDLRAHEIPSSIK